MEAEETLVYVQKEHRRNVLLEIVSMVSWSTGQELPFRHRNLQLLHIHVIDQYMGAVESSWTFSIKTLKNVANK